KFDANSAAMVALAINLGAYTIEIVRAGLEAIPKSQIEAGQSLGLSTLQIFRYIVIFPALRLMYPALASQFVLLMLATSVGSQIWAEALSAAPSAVRPGPSRDLGVCAVAPPVSPARPLFSRLLSPGLSQLISARR